jgi:hypothetical protein
MHHIEDNSQQILVLSFCEANVAQELNKCDFDVRDQALAVVFVVLLFLCGKVFNLTFQGLELHLQI